jgi:hypothetical protein
MRRLFVLVAGLGLLPGSLGCHTAGGCGTGANGCGKGAGGCGKGAGGCVMGICDCTPPVQPCTIYGLYPAHPAPVVPASAVEARPAEVVPETPKESLTKERIGYPRDL